MPWAISHGGCSEAKETRCLFSFFLQELRSGTRVAPRRPLTSMLGTLLGCPILPGGTQDSRLIFYQWSQFIKKIQLIGGQENIIKIDETPWAVFNYEQAEQIGGTQ